MGQPLLCQLTGCLPDATSLKALLSAWLKAYDLDPASIEEEHIVLLGQALEDYLGMTIAFAKQRTTKMKGGKLLLDPSAFIDAAITEHLPLSLGDPLLYNYS